MARPEIEASIIHGGIEPAPEPVASLELVYHFAQGSSRLPLTIIAALNREQTRRRTLTDTELNRDKSRTSYRAQENRSALSVRFGLR